MAAVSDERMKVLRSMIVTPDVIIIRLILVEPTQASNIVVWKMLFGTGWANAVADFRIGVFGDIFFKLLPGTGIISNFTAVGTDWDDVFQGADFLESGLKFGFFFEQSGFRGF